MKDALELAIAELQNRLAVKLKEASGIKIAINQLCVASGKQSLYEDVEGDKVVGVGAVRTDQFFNKPLATAVREFLEMKDSTAPVEEIYETLKKGGYDFGRGSEENHKRGLKISFGKNPLFTYVKSNNTYGLAKKYGIKRKEKPEQPPANETRKPGKKTGGDNAAAQARLARQP